ncbi:SDR family oxidoreductase [Streptomyces sp. CB01881]|uniref:SDR family oxidoreductase n=1 Tax=Streptomyces sp. CB01881 TaxID=2078691 RepID=UPI0013872470|nr:SDR family oxidoreductase [Streptomyces sp. CB01881]
MNRPGTMLVTGATGVVGVEIVERARAAGWHVTASSARGAADAVAWRMGEAPAPEQLAGPWDVIVHAAARPRWNLPAQEAKDSNVAPVAALEPLVGQATHVIHVSTAYATGLRGNTRSSDLADYRNTYEWSKAEAEREATSRYGATIVRPPLVVGRRSDGAVSRHTGLYSVMQSGVTGMLPVFIGEVDAPVEVVSTCDIATCVLEIAETGPRAEPVVLGAGEQVLPLKGVVDSMYLSLNRWRASHGYEPLETPGFVTPDQWDRFYLPFAKPHLTNRQLRQIDLLGEFIPYMSVGEPIGVNWQVDDPAGAIETAIAAWADRRPHLAKSSPRPWVGEEGAA